MQLNCMDASNGNARSNSCLLVRKWNYHWPQRSEPTASDQCWPPPGPLQPRRGVAAGTHLLAPVHTIFPELKISAVVRGSRILMITAAKRCDGQRQEGLGGASAQPSPPTTPAHARLPSRAAGGLRTGSGPGTRPDHSLRVPSYVPAR